MNELCPNEPQSLTIFQNIRRINDCEGIKTPRFGDAYTYTDSTKMSQSKTINIEKYTTCL